MPTFLECTFCQRLYSQHSLAIHEKGCLEAASQQELQNKLSSANNNNNNNNNRARSKSKSGKRRKPAVSIPLERPRTQSLSRTAIENDGLRICFVCGQQFDSDLINRHREKCLDDWSSQAENLIDRFHINAPKALNIPSIDGTIDIGRENQKAIQSSRDCQLVRCRGCNARITIQHANSHQCVRFEPTIEFYF